MAIFLDLPRELYLMICSLLATRDLLNLATLSRGHYLAVQRPLYRQVRIHSSHALERLVSNLTSMPVLHQTNGRESLHWKPLGDVEIGERDIQNANITLDASSLTSEVPGSALAHCIGTISSKCSDVKISLTLLRLLEDTMIEMKDHVFPRVSELNIFPVHFNEVRFDIRQGSQVMFRRSELVGDLWEMILSGIAFPDMRKLYMNTLSGSTAELPTTLARMQKLGNPQARCHRNEPVAVFRAPVVDMRQMEEIRLELNSLFDGRYLMSTIIPSTIPTTLKKLELVHCAGLNPLVHISTIATLLHRVLPVIQYFKMHLSSHDDGHLGYRIAYQEKIQAHPEHHLCPIIRTLGQTNISLDIAVPFACHHMFEQHEIPSHHHSAFEPPPISPVPAHTLPDRLVAEGYRYRRLIFNDFCLDHGYQWEQLVTLAGNQKGKVSWEILYDDREPKGVWLVSGCQAVEIDVAAVLRRPFSE